MGVIKGAGNGELKGSPVQHSASGYICLSLPTVLFASKVPFLIHVEKYKVVPGTITLFNDLNVTACITTS